MVYKASSPSLDEADNFSALRKSALLEFWKNHFAVNRYIKNTIGAGDQFNFRPKIFFQIVSHTGSPGKIVSLLAVFDGYFHGESSWLFLAEDIIYGYKGSRVKG